MTEQELEEYRKFFWKHDTDGDGQLSRTEFVEMLETMNLHLSKLEVDNLFKKTDTDHTGKISFNEFVEAFITKKREAPSINRIKQVFAENDRNHDGILNKQECYDALKQLGHVMDELGIKRIMNLMDTNHDGRVDFSEFCKFMSC